MEREAGPLRRETRAANPCVLAQLIAWKRAQYRRTRETDTFSYPWTIAMLERLLSQRGEAFEGALSALYAGQQLAAVHLGLRSYGVVHWWFPTYNRDLARYSPGVILLVEFAKRAQSLGIARIVLGKGDTEFKQWAMNGASEVAEGCVDCSPVMWSVRRGLRETRARLRASPLCRMLQGPARLARRIRGHRELR